MAMFRVEASDTWFYTALIEADSLEEAKDIAEYDLTFDDFTPDDDGYFKITGVYPQK